MPTPIWAALIIDTSFAPSPIANVTAFFVRFINSTTKAFCNGVTRQQITALHCDATSMKLPKWITSKLVCENKLEIKCKLTVVPVRASNNAPANGHLSQLQNRNSHRCRSLLRSSPNVLDPWFHDIIEPRPHWNQFSMINNSSTLAT